ncbi:MAG: FAD-binding protein [Firmicutes bacterium]|nr:FAD-binding protein [Bacillota bacterium]
MTDKTKIPDDMIAMEIAKEEYDIPVRYYGAVIVGSGAAGFGCALELSKLIPDVEKIAILSEGRNMGTSRNTGSDKQTYYKLSDGDSVLKMAEDISAAGSMHGDLALVEALSSARGFYRLVSIGVPFPHGKFGEYVGYRTDHDTAGRATSCGPLTSKQMTEALERETDMAGVPFYDERRAVYIIKGKDGKTSGVLTISPKDAGEKNPLGYAVFAAPAVVWAVGGPSAIYSSSVYPKSQTCALGCALAAGALGANMTEGQFGLASVNPRWNVSGSYQQVLPRYVSTDENGGDLREFLGDYIKKPKNIPIFAFRKGYQWPFSPDKAAASSAIDLAVFAERRRGRRVFLDFAKNPREIMRDGKCDISLAGAEARTYLSNSGCHGETPYERLMEMNAPAAELYRSFGVELSRDLLEIDVCAQHSNGGIDVDVWYESRVPGLFVIGEATGIFGVARPGGTALNSTQVGGIRSAEMISHRMKRGGRASEISPDDILPAFSVGFGDIPITADEATTRRHEYSQKMTECCSFFRRTEKIRAARENVISELNSFSRYRASDIDALRELYICFDVLLTQLAVMTSALRYADDGGMSRGSYLVTEQGVDEILSSGSAPEIDLSHSDKVLNVKITSEGGVYGAEAQFVPARVIPTKDYGGWFENIYNAYRTGEVFETGQNEK